MDTNNSSARHSSRVRSWTWRLSLAALPFILSSCSLFNPYVRSPLLKCTDPGSTGCASDDEKFVGDAAAAITAANDQRNRYLIEAGHQYAFNASMGLGMIGISADAIYKGISAKSGSTNHALIAESAGVAAIYGADVWLHNKSTESAYVTGFQAITCTLLRSRAILLTNDEYSEFIKNLQKFEDQITLVDKRLSTLQTDRDVGQENGKALAVNEGDNIKKEVNDTIKTLARSRKLLLNARAFQAEVENSGRTIRHQTDLVVSSVSTQLAQSEPNITALKSLAAIYSDPSKGVADLQAVALNPAVSVTTPYYSSPEAGPSPAQQVAKALQDAAAAANGKATVDPVAYTKRTEDRRQLWLDVSDLYAVGRKINSVLSNSQNFYVSTKRISACEPPNAAPVLEITPATMPDPVAIGATLKFTITGGLGIPQVSLSGVTGSSKDGKTSDLVVGVNGNSLTATVTILPGASGTLTLTATDKGQTGQPGQASQSTKVSFDVEGSTTAAKPSTFKATAGDKTIKLDFATPGEKTPPTGYAISLLPIKVTTPIDLTLSSAKEGTKSTGSSTVSAAISTVTSTDTTIDITGLVDGTSYSINLTANLEGGSDLQFTPVSGITPAAKSPKPAVPKKKSAAVVDPKKEAPASDAPPKT